MSEFLARNCKGLNLISELAHNALDTDTVEVYFKLFIFLYADDSVIFAESPTDMQSTLDSFREYCDLWSLTVNASKTKIVIFSNSKKQENKSFYYNGNSLETVREFVYLGVVFNSNGRFTSNINTVTLRAEKALFC